jgi:hypothetical protein
MAVCGERYLGLDVAGFWRQMEECFRPVLGPEPADRAARPDPDRVPVMRLDPEPESWPDPDDYLPDEDE